MVLDPYRLTVLTSTPSTKTWAEPLVRLLELTQATLWPLKLKVALAPATLAQRALPSE